MNMNITVQHKLNNKYACRQDAGYCGRHEDKDIYVFKIYEIKIEERYNVSTNIEFIILIRGEHTCWMNLNNFLVEDCEEDLLDYVEICHRKKLLETVTYTVGSNNTI